MFLKMFWHEKHKQKTMVLKARKKREFQTYFLVKKVYFFQIHKIDKE